MVVFFMGKKVRLFLDSGAFSAWSKNAEIDIYEYIEFIQENRDILHVYANLDCIGDPKQTWKNQKIMEREGLSPLPTYHYGEDEKWLIRYLNKGYDYIALGGMVPIGVSQLRLWLDHLFSKYLCDGNGYPIVKVHGFGLTSLPLIVRYPWYSVDSTSWVITGRMGAIFVPLRRNDEWDYLNPIKIDVSTQSSKQNKINQHIKTIPSGLKKYVIEYIEEEGYVLGRSKLVNKSDGYELKENERWIGKPDRKGSRLCERVIKPGVSNVYQYRDELNVKYFLMLEKQIPKYPWPFHITRDNDLLGFDL